MQVIEKADVIASVLKKGYDCEIRKTASGVSIHSTDRKCVAR